MNPNNSRESQRIARKLIEPCEEKTNDYLLMSKIYSNDGKKREKSREKLLKNLKESRQVFKIQEKKMQSKFP